MKNILKSIFVLLLALIMGLSIVACENDDYIEDDSDTETGDSYKDIPFKKEESFYYDEKYKDSYAGFLRTNSFGEYARFSLAYIDGDDMPELIVHVDSAGYTGVKIYTYYDGQTVNISSQDKDNGDYGRAGDVYYSEKENIICSWVCVGGGNSTGLYKIIDGKEELITEFYNDIPAPGNEITYCSANETEVSSEEYKELCESYNLAYDDGMGPSPSEHYKAAYYVDALVISEENIQNVFETE